MVPASYIQALGMILLALGAFSAVDVALLYDQPFVALGYLLSGLVLFAGGIRQFFAGRLY